MGRQYIAGCTQVDTLDVAAMVDEQLPLVELPELLLEQLRANGHRFTDDDVVHLSPARFEHINPYVRLSITYQSGMADDRGWCEV